MKIVQTILSLLCATVLLGALEHLPFSIFSLVGIAIILLPFYYLYLLIENKNFFCSPTKLNAIWLIPIAIIISFFLWYSILVTEASINYFASDKFASGIIPIRGIGALDQTSIAEFILYGAIFLIGICTTARYLIPPKSNFFQKLSLLLCAITLLISFLFLSNSLALLAAYTFIKGYTFVRLCGLIYTTILLILLVTFSIQFFLKTKRLCQKHNRVYS